MATRLSFLLDQRALSLGDDGRSSQLVALRSPWLFQVLVRLALARADGAPWVSLDDLAALDAFSGKLTSAGTKIATYRRWTLGTTPVSHVISVKDNVQRRGPYRLADSVIVTSPAVDELRRFVDLCRKPTASAPGGPVSPGAAWLLQVLEALCTAVNGDPRGLESLVCRLRQARGAHALSLAIERLRCGDGASQVLNLLTRDVRSQAGS